MGKPLKHMPQSFERRVENRGFQKNAILFGIKEMIEGKGNSLKEAIERYEAGSWGSLAYPSGLRLTSQ